MYTLCPPSFIYPYTFPSPILPLLPPPASYAFGIPMWEIYTSGRPFPGMPQALLGHAVLNGRRPDFPAGAPPGYVALTKACWAPAAADR